MSSEADIWLATIDDMQASDDMVCDAAEAIASAQVLHAVEPIVTRLKSRADSPWVRAKLISAVGFLRPKQHADFLLELLNSEEESNEARRAAALSLGWIGATAAVPSLIAFVQSADDEMIFACVRALGHLGDPRSINALTNALRVDDHLVRQAAVEALGRMGHNARSSLAALKSYESEANDAERRFAQQAIRLIEEQM